MRSPWVAQTLLGKQYAEVATCDRLKSYWWIERQQWCWAHLRRDFQAMIDRDNAGKAIGEALLDQSNPLFHLWHHVRHERLSRPRFQPANRSGRTAIRSVL